MQVQQENKPYDDINVTPMLDLAYVLLVIFIIMTTASVQGIKVNLPKASNTPSLAKPKTKAITINESGQVFLDAYPVTIPELETRLAQLKAADPELPVVVKGDAKIACIGAASILAKVARDEYMLVLDEQYPGYGLGIHKGYPTAMHLAALRQLGPSPVHRRSFGPVQSCLPG